MRRPAAVEFKKAKRAGMIYAPKSPIARSASGNPAYAIRSLPRDLSIDIVARSHPMRGRIGNLSAHRIGIGEREPGKARLIEFRPGVQLVSVNFAARGFGHGARLRQDYRNEP